MRKRDFEFESTDYESFPSVAITSWESFSPVLWKTLAYIKLCEMFSNPLGEYSVRSAFSDVNNYY